MTAEEQAQLTLIRRSLGDWALADIKRAASPEVDLPRLAFIGVAAWLDRLSILYSTKGKRGLNAWMQFVPEYLPTYKADVELLYNGLRNALLHEYGTREVALTQANPHLHNRQHGVLRVLNLNDLVSECEAAFARFCAEIEADESIRARVLPRAAGLLSPVELVSDVASSGMTYRHGAISASPTGPAGPVFSEDNRA